MYTELFQPGNLVKTINSYPVPPAVRNHLGTVVETPSHWGDETREKYVPVRVRDSVGYYIDGFRPEELIDQEDRSIIRSYIYDPKVD